MKLARAVVIAIACVFGSEMAAGPPTYVPVYGSPGLVAGVGGFDQAYVTPGAGAVNNSGVAVAYSEKVNSAGLAVPGNRGLRWSPSTPAVELDARTPYSDGSSDCRAFSVNSAGVAVGSAGGYDGAHAVRWETDGTITELADLGAAPSHLYSARAFSINDNGVAVGSAQKFDSSGVYYGWQPSRWDTNGAATELGNLGTGLFDQTNCDVYAINAASVAVGYCSTYDANGYFRDHRAVRWGSSGAAQELGNLGSAADGSRFSEAYAINVSGTSVGYASKYDASGKYLGDFAVRWDNAGSVTELEALGADASGRSIGKAVAINASGTIVGYCYKYDLTGVSEGQRAVRWGAAGATGEELGTLGTAPDGSTTSSALAENASGAAVGFAYLYDAFGTALGQRAVYWDTDGVALDLNSLVDPSSGWVLREADAISDTGWIVGIGTFSDPGQPPYTRAFLLQVPEPNSLLVTSAAALICMCRRAPSRRFAGRSPREQS
jgi:hypothetical protein